MVQKGIFFLSFLAFEEIKTKISRFIFGKLVKTCREPIPYLIAWIYIIYTPFFCFFVFVLFFRMLMFVLFCLFIGNTLTPLTALTPVSDVGKTMLQPSSLSVLGDHQQFQAGLFVFICFCLFIYLCLFCLFLFHKSKTFKLLMCPWVLSYDSLPESQCYEIFWPSTIISTNHKATFKRQKY